MLRLLIALACVAVGLAQAHAQTPAPVQASAPPPAKSNASAGERTEKRFQHDPTAAIAKRYEAWLKENWKPDSTPAADHRAAGQLALSQARDPRAAARHFARAIVVDPSDARSWLGIARSMLAIPQRSLKGRERVSAPTNATAAAYLAFQRAQDDATKAAALAELSRGFGRRNQWRPAIDALKVSLAHADDAAVRSRYLELRGRHGFRILDYRVENERKAPRVCINLSEPIAPDQENLSGFVSIDGRDAEDVTAEGKQLCLGGLRHGARYDVRVRSGLRATIGEALTKTAALTIYIRDRSPRVRFTGRNYVLPRTGQAGVPVVSINTERVDFEIFRIGDRRLVTSIIDGSLMRQLRRWQTADLLARDGARVFQGSLDVRKVRNREVVTAIPVMDAIKKFAPGIYVLNATPQHPAGLDADTEPATQWFVVSDLGLTAVNGRDGVHGFVRSLETAKPVAQVKVRLVARNNEILATGVTDADGYVRFDAGLARGEGGQAPALLVAETDAGDYGFLSLADAAFDLTDRGVKGRAPPGPIDAFLATDRGIYRPGATVHATAILRDQAGKAATLPATLVIRRPDGVVDRRIAWADQGAGGRTSAIVLANGAMTGTWRLALYLDPKAAPIAETAVLVEDFVPERLALSLSAKTKTLDPGTPGRIGVDGRYLYGPPAAGLALDGDIIVRPAANGDPAYPGFTFGISKAIVAPVRAALTAGQVTGPDGKAELRVDLPRIPNTARPLQARVRVRLNEPGGRAIERVIDLPVAANRARIGIKPHFENNYIGEGETARFGVIAVDAAGSQTAQTDLRWTLQRLERVWQWYKRDGRWTYEAATVPRTVAEGTLDARASGLAPIESKVTWGRYRLQVSAPPSAGRGASRPMLSSLTFQAGWTARDDVESPEVLDVALAKPEYAPGQMALLKVATKRGGRATVLVLANGVWDRKTVELPDGDSELPIQVSADWGAGAYVAVLLHRPMDATAKRMPTRALGLAWLAIDPAARKLNVALSAPEKVRSGRSVTVPVKVDGLRAGDQAHLTLAAVDIGILNLTRFKAPDPVARFSAQTRLGAELRDLYGRLINGMSAERGTMRTGGDAAGLEMDGSPPVHKTVALFSGLVTTDADGRARVTFDIPEFNGSLRLMAIAWSSDRTGAATHDMIVRDPVAITTSLPRFLTLSDQARLGIDLHNVDGPGGAHELTVTAADDGAPVRTLTRQTVTLGAGARRSVNLNLTTETIGAMVVTMTLKTPAGETITRDHVIEVHAPGGDGKRTLISQLAPGEAQTLTVADADAFLAAKSRMAINVGPLAAFDVPGLLDGLDRYPYGCTEQTISKAMPLLAANKLAISAGLPRDADLKQRVQAAVARVLARQASSGGFGVWSPYATDLWLTGYAVDFLTRAKSEGYTVDPDRLRLALDRLANAVAYTSDVRDGGGALAYALYNLARNGRVAAGELRYYAEAKLAAFKTPLAKAQIAAALAMIGDNARARRVFRAAVAAAGGADPAAAIGPTRADFGSSLRDAAAVVALGAEARIAGFNATAHAQTLAERISQGLARGWIASTQEQAWLLRAAQAVSETGKDVNLRISGAGPAQVVEGPMRRLVGLMALRANPIRIENAGATSTGLATTLAGPLRRALPPQRDAGLVVGRAFYTLSGQPLDLANTDGGRAEVTQNDRFVVVLSVSARQRAGRLLLVDRLPAGLEIENPRIVDGGNLKDFNWLKVNVRPAHTGFRDDRFVAAFNLFAHRGRLDTGNTFRVAYVVRAVTPGSYVHPAASVEDMYRPERHGRTGAGRLIVKPQS